jgi:pyruvate-ferredoxin/flavodoxin oxidoreductase
MIFTKKQNDTDEARTVTYPGVPDAMDGTGAVVSMETAGSEAAGAYPITPSTQMGEGWAAAVAAGKINVNGRRLLFFEPEGEHAAAGVTAGMSMVGLRATNFSSGQGIAYMHESLYAAVGKRLTYVLNIGARAMTKHALNVHAGHDDYHAVDDTGFIQLFAKDVQSAGDLNLIAHRTAELSLNPGIVAQDGFLTTHVIESIRLPEDELVKEYLGDPSDIIDSPTPAQRMVFGDKRRRIPEMFDLDYPAMLGVVQNQDSYAQGVAAQRPFYFDHVVDLADQAMEEFFQLTGRRYARAMGYRMDDAEYVLVGQGSVVPNMEAAADYLRDEKGLKVGVVDMVMFRPFPADLITQLLRGRKGVAVLERLDQPLAVDPPVAREIRAALSQAVENGRARDVGMKPYPRVAAIAADEVPDVYTGGFGFGSRDIQPGDIVAAVNNMLPDGAKQRHYYLGIDFVRDNTRMPKLEIWQQDLLEAYPHLETLALHTAGDLDLMPEGSVSVRIHSVGGWGAITMGKNVALTAFELFGLNVKANPKYGSEKKGQPTTFYATLSPGPIKVNAELKHVNVVLSPDPNVFRHSNPLAGLSQGGVFIIQSDKEPLELWRSLPASARREAREKQIKVYGLDGFAIATEEATEADLRYRMQGAAFMGAFFRTAPLHSANGDGDVNEEQLFEGIRAQMQKKFGKLGERVVEDNIRVIRRGYDELYEVTTDEDVQKEEEGVLPTVSRIPALLDNEAAQPGIGNQGRFWEQVCTLYDMGEDGIADPFAAISAIPAATSTIRDMTNIRFEVPEFIAEKCTGCAQCWVQCPDAAIPGLVNSVEDILASAVQYASKNRSFDRLKQVTPHLAKESRKIMKGVPFTSFGDVLKSAYGNVVDKLGWDAERRAQLDEEFAVVFPIIDQFPLAKTAPFYDLPESKEKGTGGLLSITINPEACKGCNICVDVCPDEALVTIKQTDEVVERMRQNWDVWQALPDTDDRYINVSNLDEGIGVLSSLLLKKDRYRSMVGGDGACMGCGEKTVVHLMTSTIEAVMRPRVAKFVEKMDGLIATLEGQARDMWKGDLDVEVDQLAELGEVEFKVELDDEQREQVEQIARTVKQLKDLKWRYEVGPSGYGRAHLGMSNSTGCSSVWGSTYPYNPYPFPWVNHLFQDAPSIAIGIFEGHMRKMADAFVAVRRAEKVADGSYDAEQDEPFFTNFDYRQFTDEEFDLCPPILAMGGDGAMLDIGFQNLSRMMASGKPIRAVILDTQVYSNTGGQASTGTYTGQSADMAPYGKAIHGKQETRKELALIALAHRGVFVHQTSQASASHLMGGIIKALRSRRPAVINLYAPCPVEHGLPDEWAPEAAKLALESRAFPFMIYDPDAGSTIADCMDLGGNPEIEELWPTYELNYLDDEGAEQTMELPLTIPDWAAVEARFKKHFRTVPQEQWGEDMVVFHEFMQLGHEDREGKTPFIYAIDDDRHLKRVQVSSEMVQLSEERLLFWAQLKELAGLKVPDWVKDQIADELESEFDKRAETLRKEYEQKLADLRATYPAVIARRLAEGLIRADGDRTVRELIEDVEHTDGLEPLRFDDADMAELFGVTGAPAAPASAEPAEPESATATAVAEAPAAAVAVEEEEDEEEGLSMQPYIETERCTTCNECTNLNKRMFAYNDNKQAFIKDAKAGTFAQLVQAAEKCPAGIIHPGDPLNPKEKDLDKWLERAKPFN